MFLSWKGAVFSEAVIIANNLICTFEQTRQARFARVGHPRKVRADSRVGHCEQGCSPVRADRLARDAGFWT